MRGVESRQKTVLDLEVPNVKKPESLWRSRKEGR